MEILTNSKRVFASRKTNLELILSTHNRSCLSCVRSGNCELQKLCKDFRVYDEAIFDGEKPASDYRRLRRTYGPRQHQVRAVPPLCRRLRQMAGCCASSDPTTGALTPISAAPLTRTWPTWPAYPAASVSWSAPPARMAEKDNTKDVWRALGDPTKHVIVQTAPSIRVTLGEAFGMPIGTNVEGQDGCGAAPPGL